MFIKTILDEMNIKEFPEIIINYFRKNGAKKYNNQRSFYSKLLDNINQNIKESYLNRILKYLSATTPSTINIFEDFNSNVYDKELKKFTKELISEIDKYNNNIELYEILNRKINFIFYEKEEYLEIKESHNNNNIELFIFLILKHTFKTYKINLPGIVSTRLYEEAMTTEYKSERRERMIKTSADLNNVEASVLQANHLLVINPDLAIDYLLKAKTKPYVLWIIGFYTERKKFSKESIDKIKKELSPLFIEDDFIKKIKSNDKDILLAVNIYYYICQKYYFSKALNSIGKLLINDIITYKNSKEKSIKIAKKYLNDAIRLGNVNAITNLSIYYSNHQEDNEYEEKLMRRLLETSAKMGDIIANYYYGKMICSQGNNEGEKYLLYSADLNHAKANFELGKIYELKNDYIKAIEYYKKAIINGYNEAAINLCKTYILLATLHNKTAYIEYAKEVLDDNIDKMSDEAKEIANKLYKDI